jgi:zinc protease
MRQLKEIDGDGLAGAVLDSGLTVLVQTMGYSQAAAVTLAYGVGSVMEAEGEGGLSHFCEHMLFKGTPANGPGVYWRMVQSIGGRANAYTSRDLTAYYSLLPSDGLRDILELEADRMMNCSMEPESVTAERKVILEEKLMTDRDDPDGAMDDALFSTAFRVHPYGRPVIGTVDDINSFSPAGVTAFYRNFYRSSNSVLAVVGPFSADFIFDQAEEVFGRIPCNDAVLREPSQEPPQTSARSVGISHPSTLRRLAMGFRVPGAAHPDSMALSLLAIHLAAGRSSRFEELFVAPGKVLDISASTNSLARPGLFTVHAVLPEGTPFEQLESAVMDELSAIGRDGISPERFQSLKDRGLAWSLITDTEPSGRSRRYAAGQVKHGDPLFYWKSAREAGSVTRDDLARVISTYFVPEQSTTVRLSPETFAEGSPLVGRTPGHDHEQDLRPPDVLPPEQARIRESILRPVSRSISDEAEMIHLENGLKLVLRPDRSFPIVSLAFSFPMGTCREPAGMAGLAEITCETMLYGTHEETSAEFNERLERIGSAMELTSLNEFAYGSATVLRGDVSTLVSSAADLLMRPAFRAADVESVLRETLAGLADWKTTPVGAAMDAFARLSTFPRELAGVPTEESVRSVTPDAIISFHRANCRPRGSVLAMVGDINPAEVRDLVEERLGSWTDPDVAASPLLEGRNASDSASASIHLDGREQIAVIMGTPAPPRMHGDTHAFGLLNGILGEGIGSRLGRRIREDAGLAYHVSSIYLPFLDRGRLAVLLLTSPPSYERAMDILKREIDLLRSGPVTDEELKLEKASTIGTHLLAGTQYGSVAGTLLTYAALDLPLDYDRISLKRLVSLTGEDLLEAADRWLGSGTSFTASAGAVSEAGTPGAVTD